MSFKCSGTQQLSIWTGDPHCQAGHDLILSWLQEKHAPFLLAGPLTPTIKGNLCECIAFRVGIECAYPTPEYLVFAANAMMPLNGQSKSDIDIIWIRIGDRVENDLLILQEVKSRSQSTLEYAKNLIDDYAKLFGPRPSTQLASRLQALKTQLEYGGRSELCSRLDHIAGVSVQTSPKVRLLPTAVHDLSITNVETKMLAIREQLRGHGWSDDAITAWAIGLSALEDRLLRLAIGER